MSIKLEKYYFDVTSETEIGFYYVIMLRWKNFSVGASGIYHFTSSTQISSFKFSINPLRTINSIQLTNAKANISKRCSELFIDHNNVVLKGTWLQASQPLDRISKPLYQDGKYSSNWKVCSALSKVDLTIIKDGNRSNIVGTGYIDFVDLNFPFTKIPFTKLYWGRLHSENYWYVFLSLETKEKSISVCYYPEGSTKNVKVNTACIEEGDIKSFQWFVGKNGEEMTFNVSTKRCLEKKPVLSRNCFLDLIPKKFRNKISSSGYDKKYEVELVHNHRLFVGIMEEVSWHE
ncbi:MAG: hypothetical protein ABFS12_11605 [Bacteroidota bacterium]